MIEGSEGTAAQGPIAIVKGEELDQMAAVAPRVEFGLGLGSPKPQLVTLSEDSKKAHHHQFVGAYNVEQGGAPFVTLATQDFLQPMERGGVREASLAMNGGEVPLQLSSRSGEQPADHLTRENRMHFHNLRMQYGFMENPHPGKSGLESSQQSAAAASRHLHQQQQQQAQQGVSNSNSGAKRPRSAQSEGDETDEGDRRKIHHREAVTRDEANSRSVDKGSASRSKHSATEQRRRSKINDRFQMLRDLLPHGDQKRDKASFLLEVIEYIQNLQEKVKRFETMEKGRQAKPWETHPSTSMKETSAIDVNKERSSYLLPGTSTEAGKGRGYPQALQAPPLLANNHTQARPRHQAQPLLSQISSAPPVVEDLTREENNPARSKTSTSQAENKLVQLEDNSRATTSRSEEAKVEKNSNSTSREIVKNGQKLPIKQGVISVSAAYSQGLLETLTSALQSSGLDLSKANISVQIELGKPSESCQALVPEAPASLQQ